MTQAKPNTRMNLGRYISMTARLGLVGGVLAVLIYFEVIDFSILVKLTHMPLTVMGVFVILIIAVALSVYRWQVLLAIKGVSVRYVDLWHINYLALFSNNFLPGGAGGDAVKVVLLVRQVRSDLVKGVLATGMDRVLGLLALLTIFIGLFLHRHSETAWNTPLFTYALVAALAAYAGIVVFVVVLIFGRKLGLRTLATILRSKNIKIINHLIDTVIAYRSNFGALAWCFAISLVMQALSLWIIAILATSLELGNVSPGDFALAGGAALISGVLPVTPGGIGVAEGVFDQVCKLLVSGAVGSFGTAFFAFRMVGMLFSLPAIFSYSAVAEMRKLDQQVQEAKNP